MSAPLLFSIATQDGERWDAAEITSTSWPHERVAALRAFVRFADAHPEMRLGQALCELGYAASGGPSAYYITDAELAQSVKP